MRGIVYKSTGSWYLLRDDTGSFCQARIRGKIKAAADISSTNPIAVGDIVFFEKETNADAAGIITDIAPRQNYIIRVSPHNRHQRHIVAANIDQAVIVATITAPRTSQGFIDRMLISAEAYHIPAVIVINKTDLLRQKHLAQLAHWEVMYRQAGYEVVPMSALQPEDIQMLKQLLADKTTLLSGHSGAGKSTLINELIPEAALRTAAVSESSGKGQHTTTFATMYDLPEGGRIIDTPGVKEFGLIDVPKEELGHYLPEIRALMPGCRFNNCCHINEPGCAVKQGVEAGTLAADRYISYLTIFDSLGAPY